MTSDSANASGSSASAASTSGTPGATRSEMSGGQSSSYAATVRAATSAERASITAVVDAGGAQQVARDRGIRPPRRLDPPEAVERHAVHVLDRAAQRERVLDRGAQQERAVDVPEEKEPAQRLKSSSALSFCAKAAISFAAFSTSSSCTISTGECM